MSESSELVIKRIDILPDEITFRCHLEEPPMGSFTDQGVSIGQALSAADKRSVKICRWIGHIFPLDLICLGIDLDDTRIIRGKLPMPSVVEDEDIPVVQNCGVMLKSKLVSHAPAPDDIAGRLFDNRDNTHKRIADQNIPVGHDMTGIGLAPPIPRTKGTEMVYLGIKMLVSQPFPYDFSFGVDFMKHIGPHDSFSLGSMNPTLRLFGLLFWHGGPFQHHGVPVVHPVEVMTQVVIFVGPHHVTVPIKLEHDSCRTAEIGNRRVLLFPCVQEISVGKKSSMTARLICHVPVMNDSS